MRNAMMKAAILVTGFFAMQAVAMASEGDLYPNVNFAEGKVPEEYAAAKDAFANGDKTTATVLAAMNPGTLNCSYYFANKRRKDDVALVVTHGPIGRNSRAIVALGTRVQLTPAKTNRSGPTAQIEVKNGSDDRRYVIEARLGTGDNEGTLLLSVISGTSDWDRAFEGAQILVCGL